MNPENVDISTFTRILPIMGKKIANIFPPIPSKVEDFDNLLKNPVSGTIDGNIFIEHSLPLAIFLYFCRGDFLEIDVFYTIFEHMCKKVCPFHFFN